MITSSAHNHCTYCDGKNTIEEMADAALAAGFTDLGISSHCVTPFEGWYALKDESAYIAAVRRAQKAYAGRLNIACGIEQDWYAPVQNREQLDYIIGSVHYLRSNEGTYYTVDGYIAIAQTCIREMFAGDGLAYARAYYELLAHQAEVCRPEIIGHFDLIEKNNQGNMLYDANSDAYKQIALAALRRCAATGAVFEVNSGGMARGYTSAPYPAVFLLEALRDCGARVMLSADCHAAENLTYYFAEMEQMLRTLGFTHVTQLRSGTFVQTPL